MENLTERQSREIEYHKKHAETISAAFGPANFNIITSPVRRWWNAYWSVWAYLRRLPLKNMKVLVVGCGAGADALYFAKLGAAVSAFDLSPDMLNHGIRRAAEHNLAVSFEQMPAEQMIYPDRTFDLVFARDILHHVDIPSTMNEVVRVSKANALFVMDEIYSHSITDVVRHSWIVERLLYPKMTGFIYKGKQPYITEDERKMTEGDVAEVKARISKIIDQRYYNAVVTRIIPNNYTLLNKLDRLALIVLGRLGYFFAGRVTLIGFVQKD